MRTDSTRISNESMADAGKYIEKNFGKDYVKLKFRNKSELAIVGALATTRGGRRNGKKICGDHHKLLDSVI